MTRAPACAEVRGSRLLHRDIVSEPYSVEPEKATELAGRAVLVVEDDYVIAQEICAMLKARGAEVVGPAASVEQGRDLMDRQPLHCAVLDVNLQGEHVYTLASELRTRGITSIFATGYDAEFLPARFHDSIFLQKPIELSALIEAVKMKRGKLRG